MSYLNSSCSCLAWVGNLAAEDVMLKRALCASDLLAVSCDQYTRNVNSGSQLKQHPPCSAAPSLQRQQSHGLTLTEHHNNYNAGLKDFVFACIRPKPAHSLPCQQRLEIADLWNASSTSAADMCSSRCMQHITVSDMCIPCCQHPS